MPDFMFTYKKTFKGKFLFLFFVIGVLLAIGTLFYHFIEGWSYLNSFYFAVISLTTRGYSELHPTTALSVIFTAFYLLIGVALVLYSLSSLIGHYIQNQEPIITRNVDKIVKKFSPSPKKEKWVVLKAPSKEQNFPPKRF
jgi:voltage-gated potassium channel